MNEHGYVKSIHRSINTSHRTFTYVWKINDNFTGGVPDAFYSGVKNSLFVEYKYINAKSLPKRSSTFIVPDLSKLQLNWLNSRYDEGLNVAVILGTDIGSVVFTQKSWEKGAPLDQFKNARTTVQGITEILYDHCNGDHHVNSNPACYHAPRSRELRETA